MNANGFWHSGLETACWLAITLGLAGTPQSGYAATTVSGPVFGVWNEAGSPYVVDGNLEVDADTTLIVHSGVQVRFQGPYILEVKGILQATGTYTKPIIFTRAYPNVGWNGIKFRSTSRSSSLTYCRVEGSEDSGISIENTQPIIRNCVIASNSSTGFGGGIYAKATTGQLVLDHCIITNNTAIVGAALSLETSADVISCSLIDNRAVDGAMSRGVGGAAYVHLWDPNMLVTFRSSDAAQNTASYVGGGFYCTFGYSSSSVQLFNCLIRGNDASSHAGGFYTEGTGTAALVNCTVVSNSIAGLGIGARSNAGVTNSIVYGNSGFQTWGEISFAYSNVEGDVPAGPGNLNASPNLDPSTLMLLPGSPCMDAGHPNSVFNDTCFPPSLGDARNDMGAFGGPQACGWLEPPTILTEPQSQSVFFNAESSISVTARGALPMRYQWLFNGQPISGAMATNYLINSVQPPDAGYYSVVVRNRAGVVTSAAAALTVPHAAIATPTVVNGFVVKVTVNGGGFGYTNTPAVRFLEGDGSGAQAVAVVSNYVVVAVAIVDPGSGYNRLPLVVISPPLILEPKMSIAAHSVITFNNLAIGTGYQLERVSAGSITPVGATITATDSTATWMFPGSFATHDYRLTVTPAPIQAEATAQVVNGFVVGLTLVNGGTGYDASPQVVISGGGGANAAATSSVAAGSLTGFTITNPGGGYTNAPNVLIAAPPSVSMDADSVAQVMKLSYEYLSPYDNYQLEFAPVATDGWSSLGISFTPTETHLIQDIYVNGSTGYFRLRYLP